jgi:hypothetical protein
MITKNRALKPSIQGNDLEEEVNKLCEKALNDAKSQLHPLIQNVELNRLDRRDEFNQAFRNALELRIAQKLAIWQPNVQAVFRFDTSQTKSNERWDGSIHLLIMVTKLSKKAKLLGEVLDKILVNYLRQLGLSRFQTSHSILEVQQVTPNEVRRGISYGAMFFAVYTVPVKVWPRK